MYNLSMVPLWGEKSKKSNVKTTESWEEIKYVAEL